MLKIVIDTLVMSVACSSSICAPVVSSQLIMYFTFGLGLMEYDASRSVLHEIGD